MSDFYFFLTCEEGRAALGLVSLGALYDLYFWGNQEELVGKRYKLVGVYQEKQITKLKKTTNHGVGGSLCVHFNLPCSRFRKPGKSR